MRLGSSLMQCTLLVFIQFSAFIVLDQVAAH